MPATKMFLLSKEILTLIPLYMLAWFLVGRQLFTIKILHSLQIHESSFSKSDPALASLRKCILVHTHVAYDWSALWRCRMTVAFIVIWRISEHETQNIDYCFAL